MARWHDSKNYWWWGLMIMSCPFTRTRKSWLSTRGYSAISGDDQKHSRASAPKKLVLTFCDFSSPSAQIDARKGYSKLQIKLTQLLLGDTYPCKRQHQIFGGWKTCRLRLTRYYRERIHGGVDACARTLMHSDRHPCFKPHQRCAMP